MADTPEDGLVSQRQLRVSIMRDSVRAARQTRLPIVLSTAAQVDWRALTGPELGQLLPAGSQGEEDVIVNRLAGLAPGEYFRQLEAELNVEFDNLTPEQTRRRIDAAASVWGGIRQMGGTQWRERETLVDEYRRRLTDGLDVLRDLEREDWYRNNIRRDIRPPQ